MLHIIFSLYFLRPQHGHVLVGHDHSRNCSRCWGIVVTAQSDLNHSASRELLLRPPADPTLRLPRDTRDVALPICLREAIFDSGLAFGGLGPTGGTAPPSTPMMLPASSEASECNVILSLLSELIW